MWLHLVHNPEAKINLYENLNNTFLDMGSYNGLRNDIKGEVRNGKEVCKKPFALYSSA
ncbi:hypothetical protein GCM10008934_37060 [Virgibacillus salarius]